jgi:hypothetical protein
VASDITLESLRAEGAQHHDPVRFRFLEVLAKRLPGQSPGVQQLLARRLQAGLVDYASQARLAGARERGCEPLAVAAVPSPLARLNQELSARAQAEADDVLVGGGASLSDMKSVRGFSEVWAKISAEQQVAQAFTRGPENAGPLNAHRLMLRSLALMRTLSPDYLRHFLSQMDSLLWLEQASAKPPRAPLKPGRTANRAKH